MKTSDFYYELPPELIAQTPLEQRDGSRLMRLNKETGEIGHYHFFDLPGFLKPGDCLVLNDSRVLPARLLGHRVPSGGAVGILLLVDRGNKKWECLVRPGRKLHPGQKVSFGDGTLLTAEILEELPGGNRIVSFHYDGIFLEILEQLGKMPLPPYIKEELEDGERYKKELHRKINLPGELRVDTAGLPQVLDFTQNAAELLGEEDLYQLDIVFPQTLEAGWYVATVTPSVQPERPVQKLLQVQPSAVYTQVQNGEALVWFNSTADGKPVAGATMVGSSRVMVSAAR